MTETNTRAPPAIRMVAELDLPLSFLNLTQPIGGIGNEI